MSSLAGKLVRTGVPKTNESLMGFILRLTEKNVYETPSWIIELAGLNMTRLYFRCSFLFDKSLDLTHLSQLTGAAPDELIALSYPPVDESISRHRNLFSGYPVPKYIINLRYPRICPGCLSESAYCWMAWDLALATACPIHECMLIDQCPGCKQNLGWVRKRLSICRCGFDWRRITSPQVRESELKITRYIFRLCGFLPEDNTYEDKSQNPLFSLELEPLLTALLFIASQYNGETDTKGKFLVRSHRVDEIHSLINKAAAVFEDWPNNYFSFLDWLSLQNNESQYPGGLIKDFGGHKSILFNLPASSPLNFMRAAFEEYLHTRWTGGYVSTIARLNALLYSKKYMPATDARVKLNTDVRQIYRLIKVGELKAVVKKQKRGRVILIDTKSVEDLKSRLEDYISLNETADLLGISRQRVHDLVADDCLRPLRGPSQDGFRIWKFSRRQVIDLLNNINTRIGKNAGALDDRTLSFFEVLRIFSICKDFGVEHLVQLILKGEIVPFGKSQAIGLKAFTFSEKVVRNYVQRHQRNSREDFFGTKEAANILGVGKDCIYSFINNGFLQLQDTNTEWHKFIISKEELDRFSNTYVVLKKVARELGTTSHRLFSLLSEAGITPVSGPSIDGSKKHLFKKDDLKKVNLVALISIAKKASMARRKDYGVFSLEQASKLLKIDKGTVRMLADSGRLRPYSPLSKDSPSDNSYCFSYHVIKNYEKSMSDSQDLVTSVVASKMLSEKRQIFYDRWVRPGHVKPVIVKGGKAKYLFRREDIGNLIKFKKTSLTTQHRIKVN